MCYGFEWCAYFLTGERANMSKIVYEKVDANTYPGTYILIS